MVMRLVMLLTLLISAPETSLEKLLAGGPGFGAAGELWLKAVRRQKGRNSRQIDLLLVVLRLGSHCVEFVNLEEMGRAELDRGWENEVSSARNKRKADECLFGSGFLAEQCDEKESTWPEINQMMFLQKGKERVLASWGR